MGKSTISMAIFNCYVSSPEGNREKHTRVFGSGNEKHMTALELLDFESPLHYVGSKPDWLRDSSLPHSAFAQLASSRYAKRYAPNAQKRIWVCLKIVYPYTQWLMIIIPFLNGYFIGGINPTFSDIPIKTTILLVKPPLNHHYFQTNPSEY